MLLRIRCALCCPCGKMSQQFDNKNDVLKHYWLWQPLAAGLVQVQLITVRPDPNRALMGTSFFFFFFSFLLRLAYGSSCVCLACSAMVSSALCWDAITQWAQAHENTQKCSGQTNLHLPLILFVIFYTRRFLFLQEESNRAEGLRAKLKKVNPHFQLGVF